MLRIPSRTSEVLHDVLLQCAAVLHDVLPLFCCSFAVILLDVLLQFAAVLPTVLLLFCMQF
jgi:hypothetical protein